MKCYHNFKVNSIIYPNSSLPLKDHSRSYKHPHQSKQRYTLKNIYYSHLSYIYIEI